MHPTGTTGADPYTAGEVPGGKHSTADREECPRQETSTFIKRREYHKTWTLYQSNVCICCDLIISGCLVRLAIVSSIIFHVLCI